MRQSYEFILAFQVGVLKLAADRDGKTFLLNGKLLIL